ncbi:MAG: phosphoribosylglycinamide formyltransferase [Gammaproteobacteria bacterium]|nr:phosphoribosylglycinamide formyltransferase [Gammaproteobacteria bacterium]
MNNGADTGKAQGIGDGPRTVVMVSGGGTNLQAIINQVGSGELGLNLCAVISDRPGVLALDRADKAGVPAHVINYADYENRETADQALAAELEALSPDLIVLAGFMRILPAAIVQTYAGRMLNIHPSLLPKFRGLHTYRRAIEAGEKQHGTTVHFVTPELDAGPSIIQYRVAIQKGETETSLATRVQQGEYLIYPKAVGWLADGRLRLNKGEVWLDGLPLTEPVIIEEN